MKHLVTERPATIKALARQALAGHWKDAVLMMFLIYSIKNGPIYLLQSLGNNTIINFLCDFYQITIAGPMQFATCAFFLNIFRGVPTGYGEIIKSRDYFAKCLTIYAMIYIRVILWSLCFVIPGIITSYKYSQAFFILAENPVKSPYQCLGESHYLMQGNKMNLFKLQFSFIGWMIIANVPCNVVTILTRPEMLQYNMMNYEDFINAMNILNNSIWSLIASLLTVMVSIYLKTAEACFFDLATDNLVIHQSSGTTVDPFTGETTEFKDTTSY